MYLLLLVEAVRAWGKERNAEDANSHFIDTFPKVLAMLTLGFPGIVGLAVFCGSLSMVFSVCFVPVALLQFLLIALICFVFVLLHKATSNFDSGYGQGLKAAIHNATFFFVGYGELCLQIWESNVFEKLEGQVQFNDSAPQNMLIRCMWSLCGWWVDLWPALKNMAEITMGEGLDLMAVPLLACSVSLTLSPLVLYGTMLAFHVYGGQTVADQFYDPQPGSNGLIRDVYAEVFYDVRTPQWGWPGIELDWGKMLATVQHGTSLYQRAKDWTPERLMEGAEGMFTFGAFLGLLKWIVSYGMSLLGHVNVLGVKHNVKTAGMAGAHGNAVAPAGDNDSD
jgi:hypothetical protein